MDIPWNVPWDCRMGWTVGHTCICKRDMWTSHGMSRGTVGWDEQFTAFLDIYVACWCYIYYNGNILMSCIRCSVLVSFASELKIVPFLRHQSLTYLYIPQTVPYFYVAWRCLMFLAHVGGMFTARVYFISLLPGAVILLMTSLLRQ